MAEHTFYLPPESWGEVCSLPEAEARHLSQVLRIPAGTIVRLLDGQGREGLFCVRECKKKHVSLEMRSEIHHPRPQSLPILALALSKAVRRGFFTEKAVELGAYQIWLWQGEHSQGKLSSDAVTSWQGQMIAGIKQSGNPWMPEVSVIPNGAAGLVAQSATIPHRLLPWESQEGIPLLTPEKAARKGTTLYVIGPEGGFSEKELHTLKEADFEAVSLGTRVLRCETAATLCLGIHWWASHLS